MNAASDLPDDKAELKAALIETRAKLSGAVAMIEHLQLVIAKMKREMFGPRSERSQRLIDQLELQLEELAAGVGEDAAKSEAPVIAVQGLIGARQRGATFLMTSRAGASFTRCLPPVHAAAATSCRRSGRMSPRLSMSFRGNGS